MSVVQFVKRDWAHVYARRHRETDPGIREVYYLPTGAQEREIRLLEVNELIAVRESDPLEPIDFGIDRGGANAHTLVVLDVTPAQWEKIKRKELRLPEGWSLDGAVPCPPPRDDGP
jgi:hypothetical protein